MIHEIENFKVTKLFDSYDHCIDFTADQTDLSEARIVIIVGNNGVGKTTTLNMIEGMLRLNFDPFRDVPFEKAELLLSTGDTLTVELNQNTNLLHVKFGELYCYLHASKNGEIPKDEYDNVESVRREAKPILSRVGFEKLDIHRSIALRDKEERYIEERYIEERYIRDNSNGKLLNKNNKTSLLSGKVKKFVREAQVDYKKYFASEGPSLFPKILKRLQGKVETPANTSELIDRFGLTLNMSDINQLTELLESEDVNHSQAVIAALEAYVETLESKHEERCLISARLTNFERLISSFLKGKSILINYENGLRITTDNDKEINELSLSSGEYHLLYMLVTALVSTRTGYAIAIDEPELSLHVSWQRKLVNALIECSSGASPLFIFATHSPAIASDYQDKWISLGD